MARIWSGECSFSVSVNARHGDAPDIDPDRSNNGFYIGDVEVFSRRRPPRGWGTGSGVVFDGVTR